MRLGDDHRLLAKLRRLEENSTLAFVTADDSHALACLTGCPTVADEPISSRLNNSGLFFIHPERWVSTPLT